jgi:hypothetical protein
VVLWDIVPRKFEAKEREVLLVELGCPDIDCWSCRRLSTPRARQAELTCNEADLTLEMTYLGRCWELPTHPVKNLQLYI